MRNNALNAYKQTKVKTAGQGKLIVMLYDEAIRQMDKAVELLESESKSFDKVNAAIIKAQDVFTELMVGLDFEKGGDIANNLLNLYMFFNQELVSANIEKNSGKIKHICKMATDLRSAWDQISNTAVSEDSRTTSGVNIAG
ncbi:flagellar export chaperone FliS [Spirochaeta cellobiosiphila]|uniref:flagellar export chaperone FliS n=1 Tax=Spirochaeta cellobiosiphila TaxID=504483 RepID=UPI00041D9D90|nr:flagellar export chaperone FliS [Spirochaeta cellobiosiphila]